MIIGRYRPLGCRNMRPEGEGIRDYGGDQLSRRLLDGNAVLLRGVRSKSEKSRLCTGVNEGELDQVEVRNDRASNEINTGWWRGSLNTRTI